MSQNGGMAMENMGIWLENLLREFSVFSRDEKFFRKFLEDETTICDKEADNYINARKKILGVIKKSWQDKNFAWFINYVNTFPISSNYKTNITSLKKVVTILSRFEISIDLDNIASILKKCPRLELIFNNLIIKKEVNEQYIRSITSDLQIEELLITYCLSKDIYVEEETKDVEINISDDDTKNDLNEIGQIP